LLDQLGAKLLVKSKPGDPHAGSNALEETVAYEKELAGEGYVPASIPDSAALRAGVRQLCFDGLLKAELDSLDSAARHELLDCARESILLLAARSVLRYVCQLASDARTPKGIQEYVTSYAMAALERVASLGYHGSVGIANKCLKALAGAGVKPDALEKASCKH
jgi:hypothetical protein